MITRKLGKLLLGKATPFHLWATCLLGAWIGFAPSFSQAPALWVVLVAAVCLLPVNLWLMGLVALVCYPLSLAVMPASFSVGRVLLDGPTRPLFSFLINTPFLALMGFEYYAASGGLVFALVVGGLGGWGMSKLTRRIRRGIRNLDQNSEKFQTWASKGWVKFGTWILFGAKPSAATYEKLEGKRVGLPIRPAGAVVAIVVVAGFFLVVHFFSGPILTKTLRENLEAINGATVDLENAEIRLGDGKVVIEKLAMADPNQLDTDLLRGLRVEADLGVGELLTRRYRVDKLIVTQTSSGSKRDPPGKLTGTEPEPQTVPGEEKTLDDYVKEAQEWRDRLAQVRRWLEEISGQPDPDAAPTDEEKARREETLEAQLERLIQELGYARVAAEHLLKGTPRFSIGELRMEGLEAMQVGGKPFDIVGENLSTNPQLLDAAPRLSIRARDGSVVFDASLAGASRGGGKSTLEFSFKGLPGDAIGSRLKTKGDPPLRGGTIDFSTKGTWSPTGVDLPFQVVLNGTTLALPGTGRAEKIDHLELPLKLTGPLDDPRVLFREEDLAAALTAAGKKELAKQLEGKLPDDVKKKLDDAGGVGGLLDKFKKK